MKTLVRTALLFALAAPAAAQDGPDTDYTAGFNVGASIPARPDIIKDTYSPGVSIAGFVTGRISGPISWRGELGYDKHSCDEAICGSGGDFGFDITRFAGGVQVSGQGRTQGYGFFTLGGYNQEATVSFGGASTAAKETRFGLSFGGGVNFFVGDTWGLGGDVHVNSIFQEGDAETLITVVPSGVVFFAF